MSLFRRIPMTKRIDDALYDCEKELLTAHDNLEQWKAWVDLLEGRRKRLLDSREKYAETQPLFGREG